MSGLVSGLGARSGLLGTTENWNFANKAVLPGGIDAYTVALIRSDHLNNELCSGGNCDIAFRTTQTYGTNGDPRHDTMAGNVPQLEHPDGHILASVINFDGNDSLQFGGTDKRTDFSFMRDDYTVDWWVKMNNVSNDQYMLSFGASGPGDGHFAMNLNGSNFRLGPMTNSAHGFISCAHGLSVGTWYHLAYSRSGNNTFAFKDGVIIGTGTVSSQIDIKCTSNIYFGGYQGGGAYLAGQMAEMRVSKGIARWTAAFPKPSKAYF